MSYLRYETQGYPETMSFFSELKLFNSSLYDTIHCNKKYYITILH